MKATILAAGKGTRVRPITDIVPKPMIPIINKPVMEFLVELLKRHGFDEILISTAYLAAAIENYFGEGSGFGVRIGYSFEGYHREGQMMDEGLGSAGGLRKIQDFSGFFDDTFVILCGDAIVDLDLTQALAFHRSHKALATIILKEVPLSDVNRYGIVVTDPDGRIVRFQEKPRPEEALSTTANTGIYIFEPEVLDLIPAGTRFDIGSDLFPLMAAQGKAFYGLSLPFTWIDIGRTSDYWSATQKILKGELRSVEIPGRLLAPGIWGGISLDLKLDQTDIVGPVYIGSSSRIEPGAIIRGPSVIGRNSVIESGAHIEASIIGSYTRVSGMAALKEKIVSGRFCVDRFGNNVDLASTGYNFVIDDAREHRNWSEEQKILIDFLSSREAEREPGTR